MNNRNSQNGSSLGMLLKIVGGLYLAFFGYGFVREYVFTRTDSQSHTTGIVVGIVCLVILIPLLISTIQSLKKTRKYVQRNMNVKPAYNEAAVNPNAKKPKHTGNTKNRGRGKKR